MKKYCNYILGFSDGSVKVGVTSRPETRVAEICSAKRHSARLVQGAFTPLCEKSDAFQIEAKLCSLLSYRANDGTREWFRGGAEEYQFLRQATGMFWQMACNQSRAKELHYNEVAA